MWQSLELVAGIVLMTQLNAAGTEQYVGARVCGGCHPKQYAQQSRSHHARALRRGSALGDLGLPLARVISDAVYDFENAPAGLRVTVTLGGRQAMVPIDWIVGAGDQGATFFSRMGSGRFLEHRLSYYARKKGYDVTAGHHVSPPATLEQAMGVPLTARDATQCLRCHSTVVGHKDGEPDFADVSAGVACERCHGPGAAHAASAQSRSPKHIRNPARLSGTELLATCGECHRTEPPPGMSFDEPIVARFQPVGLQMSACFLQSNGRITCTTCHDPHGDARRADDAFYESKCLACHAASESVRCPVNPRQGCLGCHMAKTDPLPWLRFTDHWIRVRN